MSQNSRPIGVDSHRPDSLPPPGREGEHQEGFLRARDGLRLFWQADSPANPKAQVVVVHGYGEHCGRYRELIDALVADRFEVMAFDYRGHGRSEGRRGYCNRFSEYLDDLQVFLDHLRARATGRKKFLLGHSHGGLIAIHYFARQPKESWSGLVLSSPYLRLAITPPAMKVLAAKLVEKVVPWMPFKSEIAFKQLTRDPQAQEKVSRDPLYSRTVTPRWFSESTRAQEEARALGGSIKLPVLAICGSEDPIASTPDTRAFFPTIGASDKNYKEYPGMLHETLNEIGKEEVWREISHWISAHS